MIIWQIGLVGNPTSRGDASKLPILIEYLEKFYDLDCGVVHYQGSVFPVCAPVIERLPLRELGCGASVTNMSTLLIPPQKKPTLDREMAWRLGLVREKTRPDEPLSAADSPQPPPYKSPPDQSALASFIWATAEDPDLLGKFENDSKCATAAAGLSPEEFQALLTRMPGRIWTAINSG